MPLNPVIDRVTDRIRERSATSRIALNSARAAGGSSSCVFGPGSAFR